MGTHITKETFEFLYNNTYQSVLKYTMCHCRNLDDINDIVQDIYTELFQTLSNKKYINLENVESYIIGIAKNKIKRYYNLLKIDVTMKLDENIEVINDNDIDIEKDLITKDNVLQIWNYLKSKSEITAKIFYLYYVMEFSIKTISNDMQMTESNIKNHLYRTKKELQHIFKKGDDCNVRK